MPLLLTILSVLIVWALLGVLAAGLFVIHKVLLSVRDSLERIAMGVRAIEREVQPLGPRTDEVARTMGAASAAATAAAGRMAEVDRDLDAAAPALRVHG